MKPGQIGIEARIDLFLTIKKQETFRKERIVPNWGAGGGQIGPREQDTRISFILKDKL